MASKEELDAAIKAKGDEIRELKKNAAEKPVIQAAVDALLVSFMTETRSSPVILFTNDGTVPVFPDCAVRPSGEPGGGEMEGEYLGRAW